MIQQDNILLIIYGLTMVPCIAYNILSNYFAAKTCKILYASLMVLSIALIIVIPFFPNDNDAAITSLNALSRLMILLIYSILACIYIYSLRNKNLILNEYIFPVAFCLAFMATSDNFIAFFLYWQYLNIVSYFFKKSYHDKNKIRKFSINQFIFNRVGDSLFLISMVLMYYFYKTSYFYEIQNILASNSDLSINIFNGKIALINIISCCLMVVTIYKLVQLIFLLHIGNVAKKLDLPSIAFQCVTIIIPAILLIVKFGMIFEYSEGILCLMYIIGSVSSVIFSFLVARRNNNENIIVYLACLASSYILICAGLSSYHVAIFYLLHITSALTLWILTLDNIFHYSAQYNVSKVQTDVMPFTYASFLISVFSIVGIFPLTGFYANHLIIDTIINQYGMLSIGFVSFLFSIVYITISFGKKTFLLFDTRQTYNISINDVKDFNWIILLLVIHVMFSGMIYYYVINLHNPFGYLVNTIFNISYDNIILKKNNLLIKNIYAFFIIFIFYISFIAQKRKFKKKIY